MIGIELNNKSNWSVQPYREGDENQIFELWDYTQPEMRYVKQLWVKRWYWTYRQNPNGTGWIGLAQHNNRIIAHFAAIPVTIKVGSKIITGFQAVNMMTHPGYRGLGIYKKLAKEVYAKANGDGARIGFTFPNELSYTLLASTREWFHVADIRKMVRVLRWEKTLKGRIGNKLLLKCCAAGGNIIGCLFSRVSRVPFIEGLSVTQISRFDDRISRFCTSVSKNIQIVVIKNKDYLNWRYVDVPGMDYSIYIAEKAGEIQGYIIFRYLEREYNKIAIIYDLLFESDEVSRILLSRVMERCRRENADYVYWYGVADDAYINTLKRSGFITQPFQKVKSKFIVYSCDRIIPKDFLGNPGNWLVQRGDSDAL